MKPIFLVLCALGVLEVMSVRAELPPLIPRELLFDNPKRTSPTLSPNASRMAWLAPDTNNVLQVWVQTVGQEDARIVTADKKRGIREYAWAKDNRTLLYMQDNDGDENFHVYGVDLVSGNVRDYSPFQGIRASLLEVHPTFPNEALLTMNLRDRGLFDVYRLNLTTGALVLDTQNPGDVVGWTTDAEFKVRLATVATADGGTELRVRANDKAPWKSFLKVGPDEILSALSFNQDGKAVFLSSSVGRDTAALVSKNLEDGDVKVLAEHDKVDAEEFLIHPITKAVQAVSFAPGRSEWKAVDPAIEEDLRAIAKVTDGDFNVVDRTDADDTWLVSFDTDRAPVRYYRWDRKGRKASFLFTTRPRLEGLRLAEMKPVVIRARDGMEIYSYLALPAGLAPRNLPMVLFPHGGPWARDTWGFDGYVQWLANRGYAVLQPNFRGSTGYGKKHLNAGDRQWGLKMHDDLIDCVNWAVKEGIADPKRVAIMGGSYGGYATLAGLTFTPEVFACGVDIVGPSNLKTLLKSIPPYWKPMMAMFSVRVGNINDPKDNELLDKASPLNSAHRIVRPLLIGQGANDPRVKQAESEQIVAAIEKNRGQVIYVLYPDEGHGFARPENRMDFNARTEAFLAQHLKGRFEPLSGEKIPGSTAVVKVVGQRP